MKRTSTMRIAAMMAPVLLATLSASAQSAANRRTPANTTKPAAVQPWKKIVIPPLHAFKPVQPRRIELANGLVIFLQEDHELPFINGSILIRGGSRDEPAAKAGLVTLYGQTWRTSGTATQNGDQLDDQMEAKAAQIETNGSIASTSVRWSSLKGDFDTVFAATVDVLLHPAFRADKLQLAKRQMETASRAATTIPATSPSARRSSWPTARTIRTRGSRSTPPSMPSRWRT